MTGLAKTIKLEESAIIEYAIRGIEDDERNKIVLYGAKTLVEFKQRISTYQTMRAAINEKRERAKISKVGVKATVTPEASTAKNATAVSKHQRRRRQRVSTVIPKDIYRVIAHTPRRVESVTRAKCTQTVVMPKAMCVYASEKDVSYIDIVVSNLTVSALFDTGSDVSIIREDVYNAIGKPTLIDTPRVLTGLGGHEVTSRGYMECEVKIQCEVFKLKLNVIPNVMNPKIVIGKDLLVYADVKISRDGLCVSKRDSVQSSVQLPSVVVNNNITAADEFTVLQIEGTVDELNVVARRYSAPESQRFC